ncbi:hypothetical protein ACH50_05370 [Franconibacter pulveris]|uniref:Uncharacterized protein n=1 Tax=Franconibacter pulveris TaxID=435910 RepID=A0A0J8VQK3_9ENTR|nr:hypothetical protein ACH50_05370 [Franconibacter pulveris]
MKAPLCVITSMQNSIVRYNAQAGLTFSSYASPGVYLQKTGGAGNKSQGKRQYYSDNVFWLRRNYRQAYSVEY